MNGLVVLLWSAAIALVLIVGGIFISLVMMDRISFSPEAQPPAPQQTQGTAPKIDTSYRVLMLNATPEAGMITVAREALLAEGWPADGVFGSEGSSQEFDKTTVFYVDAADEAAALGVAEVLGGAEVQQSDFYADLNESDQPQLTVVIGLDRVTESTPEAEDAEEAPAE